jgi:cytidyltransferase-like protein
MSKKIDQFFYNLSKCRELKFKNKKIVLVGGCFDILHIGHIQFLNKSKVNKHFLAVALEPDEFIIKKKGRTPIHNQTQRKLILESLRVVDWVIKLPYFTRNKDYQKLVEVIKPNIIAITENDSQLKNKSIQANKVGATIATVTSKIGNLSTSKIINNNENDNY